MCQIHSRHFHSCRFLVSDKGGENYIREYRSEVNEYWQIRDMKISSHNYSSIHARMPENAHEYSVFGYFRRIEYRGARRRMGVR